MISSSSHIGTDQFESACDLVENLYSRNSGSTEPYDHFVC